MPKVEAGRLDGVWGMETFAAEELFAWADKLEAQIKDPANTDDPRWLQRRADKVRRLAGRKEKAFQQRNRQKHS
jgi:hypothetical protein